MPKKSDPNPFGSLIPLALIVLIICALTGVYINTKLLLPPKTHPVVQKTQVPQIKKSEIKVPVLNPNAKLPMPVTGKGVYAYDPVSGKVLFSKNPDQHLLPASTTKIATAMVAIEAFDPNLVLTIEKIGYVDGQKVGFQNGEKQTIENLLFALLLHSGNDAAEILADNYPGGRASFIDSMNRLAKNLGLENTHFVNPTGFDNRLHYSSARDLANLASYAVTEPLFARIVSTKHKEIKNIDGNNIRKLTNINKLLGVLPGVTGIKTGWTEGAGESLVTLVERDNHKVIITLLGSSDRFLETEKIIEWIYQNYTWQ